MKATLLSVMCTSALFASVASAEDHRPNHLKNKGVGMELTLGGGASRFIDQDVTSATDSAGGNWDARLLLGSRRHIGLEGAYVGTAQGLNALGLSDRATLMSNGVEGALRWNVLTHDWQPYLLAGYTWRHYRVANSEVNFSSVADAANISQIPVAAGLAYRFKGFVADLRFGVHAAVGNNEIIPQGNMSTYGLDGKLGFEF